MPSAVSGVAGDDTRVNSGEFDPADQGFDLPWLTDMWAPGH